MGLAGESSAEGEDRTPAASGHAVRGVYVAHIELLFGLINDRLAAVFEANRYFEEQTGISNKAGANNLTEALSHIGTLVEYAGAMDSDEQREQVAYFGDHLRRSMMESFEQVVKARLGKIKQKAYGIGSTAMSSLFCARESFQAPPRRRRSSHMAGKPIITLRRGERRSASTSGPRGIMARSILPRLAMRQRD
jgi:hypothetical protein